MIYCFEKCKVNTFQCCNMILAEVDYLVNFHEYFTFNYSLI